MLSWNRDDHGEAIRVERARASLEAFMALPSRYLTTREDAMNAFYEHHHDSIRFGYRCFDRILLNGLIQPFQQPERVIGFFGLARALQTVVLLVEQVATFT
jgi:hypothetical protein